jgi:hypothetical protein
MDARMERQGEIKWYWCLHHERAEPEDGGEQFEARNQAWDDADAEWEGDE